MSTSRIQIQPPEPLDGNGDFEDWAWMLISYLSLPGARYREIVLNYAIDYSSRLTPEEVTSEYDDDLREPHRETNYLGTVLFKLIMSFTKDPAYPVTKSTTNERGFETSRLPKVRYGKTKRHMMTSTIMRNMLQKFDASKFVEQLARWEFDIEAYEKVTMVRLPELLQTTLLITKTSGSMYRFWCMQVTGDRTYEETKAIVVNYCKTTSLTSRAQAHG